MSRLLAAMLIALAPVTSAEQQAPVRDSRTVARVGSASLTGTTHSDAQGNPAVPFAQVGVLGLDSGVIRVTSSDADGRFSISGLPAGRYLVSGAKPPFVGAMYGAQRAGRAGTPVALAEGESRGGIQLTLTRGAAIAGIVTDESGQPAPGVSLMLTPAAGGTMQQQLMTIAFTPPQVADDRGMYRFSGLPPGEYLLTANHAERFDRDARVLSVEEVDAAIRALGDAPPVTAKPPAPPPSTVVSPAPPPAGLPNTGLPMAGLAAMMMGGGGMGNAYAPVYYPGTVNAADAVPIRVVAGEERAGVDLIARRIPTSRIEGQVIGVDGQPVAGTMLRLRQADQGDVMSLSLMALSSSARVGPDGRFSMEGVPPGNYTLEARTFAMAAAPPGASALAAVGMPRAQYFAAADVTVFSNQPATGVVLRMQSGAKLSGRVAFNATVHERPKDFSSVLVALAPATQGDLFGVAMNATAGRVAADGTFTVEGVVPGRYLLTATVSEASQLLRWMPSSVLVGGRETADLPVEVRPGEDVGGIEITLTDAQQEVSGTLQDASGRAATDFTILLFPVDPAYWLPNSRRVLSARPATDGLFAFQGPLGPPAGEYFLAAVTELAPEDLSKPAFLSEVAKAAIKIRVAPGQKTRQDVRISR